MRKLACLLLLTLAPPISFACTCIPNPSPVCRQLRSYHGGVLFVGKAKSIRFIRTVAGGVPIQVTVFVVEEVFSGSPANELKVRSYPPSMCGYPFKLGKSYLVDASSSGEAWMASACGITAPEPESQDAIRFLRALKQHPDGAIIFGTVKEYVGAPNFVSLNNRGIGGAKVILQEGRQAREIQVDESGWYQATGLRAGTYTVTPKLPTRFLGVKEHSVDVFPNGCSQIDFRTKPATN